MVHAHDWQAGLAPVYLKTSYWDDPVLRRTASVFTIHNVAYQGQFAPDTLGPRRSADPSRLQLRSRIPGGVSYLKGGTVFAEMVSTVSPTYALEIQGPEHGFGFQDVIRSRAEDVVGILNGVDYEEWDPRNDERIARRYSPRDDLRKAALQGGSAADLRV